MNEERLLRLWRAYSSGSFRPTVREPSPGHELQLHIVPIQDKLAQIRRRILDVAVGGACVLNSRALPCIYQGGDCRALTGGRRLGFAAQDRVGARPGRGHSRRSHCQDGSG